MRRALQANKMPSFSLKVVAAIRGYHIYKELRETNTGEILSFQRETARYICLREIVPILTSGIEGSRLPSLPYKQRNKELHLSVT